MSNPFCEQNWELWKHAWNNKFGNTCAAHIQYSIHLHSYWHYKFASRITIEEWKIFGNPSHSSENANYWNPWFWSKVTCSLDTLITWFCPLSWSCIFVIGYQKIFWSLNDSQHGISFSTWTKQSNHLQADKWTQILTWCLLVRY
jgi:hypothetical protein